MFKTLSAKVCHLLSSRKKDSSKSVSKSTRSSVCDETQEEKLYALRFMPAEIIHHVFSFLNVEGLCAVCVCHQFKSLAMDNSLWKRFFVRMVTQNTPSARVCHSSVVHRGKMYIYGGHVPDQENCIRDVNNDFYCIQLASKKWEQLMFKLDRTAEAAVTSPTSLPLKTEHTAVIFNNKMYLFGGYSGSLGYRDSAIYEFDFERKVCIKLEVAGEVPPDRSAHVAVVYDKYMYVFGGWDGAESNNDFYRFDLERRRWSKVVYSAANEIVPPRIRSHSCALFGDSLVIFGGYGEAKHLDSMYSFNFTDSVWKEIPCLGGPCGRSRSRMVHHADSLYCFGGWDRKSYFNDLWRFKLDTYTWHKESATLEKQQGIGQHSLVVHEGRLVLFGGYCPSQKLPMNGLFVHRLPSPAQA